jgi:hypothetical protein
MSGEFSGRWTGRTLIAVVLCLLAFTFAVEAKMAWYLPPHTVGTEVQAAKALRADVPQVILHGLPDHNPIFPLLPLTLLLGAVTAYRPTAYSLCAINKPNRSPKCAVSFSPANFFRPPPSR